MSSRRRQWLFIVSLSATVAGCAQSGSVLSRGTSVGTLKTSLSHMEYENQQLRKEVASLKAEVRQTEDRLVQEESANGELSSRLDNALVMLKRRGLSDGDVAETNASDSGRERPATTLPAGRSSRKARKPPFAQIPGRIDTLPSDDESSNGWGKPVAPTRGNPGPQSRLDHPTLWLPVARGTTSAAGPLR